MTAFLTEQDMTSVRKYLKIKTDEVLVDRKEYEILHKTIRDLQQKYQAILDDKQRWRNFALLSSATLLIAHGKAYEPVNAIRKASELLNIIEGANVSEATGASAGV